MKTTNKKKDKKILKIINDLSKKIIKNTKNLPKTKFVFSYLISEIILINLEIENLIFKRNYNPSVRRGPRINSNQPSWLWLETESMTRLLWRVRVLRWL